MPLIEVRKLRVFYDKNPVVDGVSFTLKKGETLAIIGPNGSGKTTLLRALIGAMSYDGEIVMSADATIGYVPQKIDLERDLPVTVREFLLLHRAHKVHSKKVDNLARGTLESVGLSSDLLDKGLGHLSAGELQRALIAFALIDNPTLLFFDEPTASIDAGGQETVYDLLRNLQQSRNFATILISHDLSVVYRYAHTVLCLNHTQVCLGSPKEVLTPKSLATLYGEGKRFYTHSR